MRLDGWSEVADGGATVTITLRGSQEWCRVTIYGTRAGSRPQGRPLARWTVPRHRNESVRVMLERALQELAQHPEYLWVEVPEFKR